MRRWKSSLLLAALAALSLAQSPSQLLTPEMKRVGMKLACLCKTCKNTVGDCPMLQCHYAHPAREKIIGMQGKGISDEAIVKSFVDEQGLQAYAVPPTTGFSSLAWIMPWAAVALGLLAIWLFVKKYRKQPAAAPELDPELLKRYHDNIEKDLAKLD